MGVKTKYFDYGETEISYLSKADTALGLAMEQFGKIQRTILPDLFEALLYAIVGQQISLKAANTVWDRLQLKIGDLTPDTVASQPVEGIQSCGMSMRKAQAIQSIAQNIVKGEFSLYALYDLPDDEVIKRLSTLNGVGIWTAEMLLINSMERPDVVSWGDIAIRRGMMKLYNLESITKQEFDLYRARYSPFGSVASIYLWRLSHE